MGSLLLLLATCEYSFISKKKKISTKAGKMAQRAKVPLSHLTSIHRWKDRTDLTNRYTNKTLKF